MSDTQSGNGRGWWGREQAARITEHREHTSQSEITWPLAQALLVALFTALLAAVSVWTLLQLTSGVYALIAFVFSLASWLWVVLQVGRLSRQEVTFGDIGLVLVTPLLVGRIFWYAWELLFLNTHNWRFWSGGLGVVFVAVTCFLLWISYGQELAQRSPQQELYGWRAFGALVETFGEAAIELFFGRKAREPVEAQATPQPTVRVDLTRRRSENGGKINRASFFDLEIDIEDLRAVAKAIDGGATFTERNLAGRGRPLSGRTEFEKLRDFVVEAGLARWRDPDEPRQGVEVTADGAEFFAQVAAGASVQSATQAAQDGDGDE